MCLSLYALLLRTRVIDLHAKNQHNICKCVEKSLENCFIGVTKLKLDLYVMVIDLHAKKQLNICKRLENKCGKLVDR